jgi:uridine phosphorylase
LFFLTRTRERIDVKQFDKHEVQKGKKQYHIALKAGDIGEYVLLPGDPDRSTRVAKYLDGAELVQDHREHRTFTGTYKGVKISVTSTGMGCPSATIAAEELINIGAKVLIRIGSCAAFRDDLHIGDLVVSLGAMKDEGTSRFYVPDNFPAVPDRVLTNMLIDVAEEMKGDLALGTGITCSVDAFYAGHEWERKCIDLGITNCDMESSAIFTIAHVRGVRAATICGVSSNLKTGEFVYDKVNEKLANAWEQEIKIVLESIYRMEQAKTES